LANDFGKALQSGGHLSVLRRTKIGDFNVNDALKIEDFARLLPDFEEN
jgi:tRNA pseudouridine55 synthase